MHPLIALGFIAAAWKWGDWKNWKKYYPTMLYLMVGNLAYHQLCYDKLLWMDQSPYFSCLFLQFIWTFMVFPATVLLYLPHFPQSGQTNKIVYLSLWASFYTGLEAFTMHLGFFSHHHGWNLRWSLLLNFLIFSLLKLHYEKPLIVWPISLILALILMSLFDIPIRILKAPYWIFQ